MTWVCKVCKTNNDKTAKFCVVCGNERSEEESVAEASVSVRSASPAKRLKTSGIWVCKFCMTNNPADATECAVCGGKEKYVESVIEPIPSKPASKSVAKSTPTSTSSSSSSTHSPSDSSPRPSSYLPPSTSTPSRSDTSTTTRRALALEGWQIALIVIGCAVLVAGVTLLGVFGSQIYWWEWQHIIGSIVGSILVGIVILICWIMYEQVVCLDVYKPGIIGASVIALLNIALGFAFKNDYNIIFYWIGAYSIVGLIVATVLAYNDSYSGWGQIGFTCLVIAAVFFIIITILSVTINVGYVYIDEENNNTSTQWAVGILVGAAFVVGMFILTMYLSDSSGFVAGLTSVIINTIFSLINLSLGAALGEAHNILFSLFAAALIISSGVGIFWSYMDSDARETRIGNSALICLNIAMIVIINVYVA